MSETVLSKEVSLSRLAAAQAASRMMLPIEDASAMGALAEVEQHRNWPLLSQMPLKLNVAIPLPRFKVKDLLALRAGQIIASVWKVSEDVPVQVGGVELAWSEFEVVEQRMAVRLTRLG